MAKGRKSGCPVNITNWLVYIQDKATSDFVRVYGLSSLSYSVSSDTDDGSVAGDAWSEPYVSKRSASLSLEGKPIVDAATGAKDPGQEMLTDYASLTGCDADATLKIVDANGHAFLVDVIVTGTEESADESEQTISWSLEQVGETEQIPYVQVSAVALKVNGTATNTLAMSAGDPAKVVTLDFTPADASNQRYRVGSNKRSVASVSNVTETGFSVNAVSAGTATITVTTVNGGRTATLTVTVS